MSHDIWVKQVARKLLCNSKINSVTDPFPPLALQPPVGVVFYSPLVGFSLLAYELS